MNEDEASAAGVGEDEDNLYSSKLVKSGLHPMLKRYMFIAHNFSHKFL